MHTIFRINFSAKLHRRSVMLVDGVLYILTLVFTFADIFCSMPKIFTDMQYTICIYVTGTDSIVLYRIYKTHPVQYD